MQTLQGAFSILSLSIIGKATKGDARQAKLLLSRRARLVKCADTGFHVHHRNLTRHGRSKTPEAGVRFTLHQVRPSWPIGQQHNADLDRFGVAVGILCKRVNRFHPSRRDDARSFQNRCLTYRLPGCLAA
jgi:hypothetical protein